MQLVSGDVEMKLVKNNWKYAYGNDNWIILHGGREIKVHAPDDG